MRVRIVTVGKMKGPLRELAADYEKRAARYWRLTVEETKAGSPSGTPAAICGEEGQRLLGLCEKATSVWLLTRDGKTVTSTGLSKRLAKRALHSESEIAILIGGAFGFSAEVRARADETMSLSRLTLPHELARVVLLEQLYRAGTIIRGEPYHKGPNS